MVEYDDEVGAYDDQEGAWTDVSTEVNDKILLVVLDGSAGCNLFKKASIFSSLTASDFSWNNSWAEEFPLLPLHSTTACHTITFC